jgi:hypothetical protein
MGEQDHKLNSMIGLISTMAEETHFFRSKLSALQHKIDGSSDNTLQFASQLMDNKDLIDVSDDDEDKDEDEDDEDDEDDDEEVTDEDDEDDEEVTDEDDEDDEEVTDDDADSKNNDILNVEALDDADINIDEIHMDDINNINMDEQLSSEVKTIHIDLDTNDAKLTEDDMGFLKNVPIDLGENEDKHDYKKMSLNKLREVVVAKGVVSDASKLKKNDILKLLGDE